jgi:mono/diheme cytochrome c family protein
MMRPALVTLTLTLALVGCEKEKTFEPPDRGERVAEAEIRYSPAMFDSISWVDDETRAVHGNETYAAKCRNCHGTMGRGDTPYAADRNLIIPSLVEEDWPWADSLSAVRHRIFVGHEAGMPTWGVAGITAREIDASAYYVLEVLRPDALGNPGEAEGNSAPDGR